MLPQGTRDRAEADNFLKALYGLTKMLKTPSVDQFLVGLNKLSTTTLGHLITFMHTFNLRFGAAKTPEQEAAYDQLYPILVALRDQVNAPSRPRSRPRPTRVTPGKSRAMFSGMDMKQLQSPGPRRRSPASSARAAISTIDDRVSAAEHKINIMGRPGFGGVSQPGPSGTRGTRNPSRVAPPRPLVT